MLNCEQLNGIKQLYGTGALWCIAYFVVNSSIPELHHYDVATGGKYFASSQTQSQNFKPTKVHIGAE
jgi:hypothetical protein